ncbi:MAG TPA: methionyl-tRNA formyltransferase, partial [Dehalococcoidales bacterium]|nr:methionyl-tRNA formyltransferase [Dehalococcoidales bacterium]
LRLVFMGSPQFAVPVLRFLHLSGHEIAAVYTRPDKPSGRGLETAAPPVKSAAQDLGLPVVQVGGFKSPEVVSQLAALKPQAIIVAAFGLILPKSVLEIAPLGCINIHPSLLPRYRGPSPVISTLLAGDKFAGVSVMQLDEGMDSGPVLARAQVTVMEEDDALTLTARLFEIGARMVLEALAEAEVGQLRPEPQDEALATFTRQINREDGRIDWSSSALEIWRKTRAFQPWPQAYTYWQGQQVKILQARPLPDESQEDPGRVLGLSSGNLLNVKTGSGTLGVNLIQIEGKRAMQAREFLRGQRDFIGSRFD